GDKIAGTVKRELVGQFERVLQEGERKVLINFTVTNSGGSYRTTKHPFKIVFLQTTRVRICEFAEDVSNAIQMWTDKSIVCVLRFGKIKVRKEEHGISNVSTVALNPQMDEVQAFMSLLPKDDLALPIVNSKSNAMVPGVKDKDDFFLHTPRKTITQVLESKQVEKCIVMAAVAVIDSDMDCYKVCAKKVLRVPDDTEDGEDFNVRGHNYFCVKYKLHLVVLDNTNNTKFMMFDNLALQLLHKPCSHSSFHYSSSSTVNSRVPNRCVMEKAESNETTPAKRTRPAIINLGDAFDQYYVSKTACTIKVKKEKDAKSG
ncbi:hypothetical protein N665_0156s0023, partial [Sinapis alba]